MERDKVHGDEGGHGMKMIELQLRKEERKNKTKEIKEKVYDRFCFCDQDTMESVITFRIISHTIKRGNLWLNGYRVPLGNLILTYAFRNLVC
jgi:hypothetical protein